MSFILSCKHGENSKDSYIFQISGNLKTFAQEIILLQNDEATDTKTLLIAEKKNGNFYFKSKDSLPNDIYFINIGNEPKRVPVLIDNTDITVYLDNLNLDNSYTVGASDIQKNYNTYLSGSKNTNNLFAFQKRFVEENKASFLAAIVIKDMLGPSPWRLKQTLILYEQLDSTIQQSELGRDINTFITKGLEKMIETIKADEVIEAEVVVSKNFVPEKISEAVNVEYAPYFYGDGLDGIEINAKDVFTNNQMTLLDFWASWCVPCRAQNPDYVRLYNKYHSRGFEILSIAADKESANWENAILTDNMNWLHINDPYNQIANTYKVHAIPYAILVNQKGEILANKISISRLENMLKNDFGN